MQQISMDTALGEAIRTYDHYRGMIKDLENKIKVLKENKAFKEAKAELHLRCKMNEGSFVASNYKVSIVHNKGFTVEPYDYITIRSVGKIQATS